jgi:predicted nucleotidyltransferase
MVDRTIRKIIVNFVKLLGGSNIPVSKVILFGSYANGTAREDSDIDVAVVSERFGHSRLKEGQLLFKKARLVDSRIEPIPVSVDDYDHDEDSPILYEIKKSGIEIELKPSGRKLAKM